MDSDRAKNERYLFSHQRDGEKAPRMTMTPRKILGAGPRIRGLVHDRNLTAIFSRKDEK